MILDILDAAGSGVRHGRDGEITICCPFCVGRGESTDTRYRLGVNTVKGLASCFNCGWKCAGVLAIARELCTVYGLPFRYAMPAAAPVVQEEEKEELLPVGLHQDYEALCGPKDAVRAEVKQYLSSRGITPSEAKKFKLGFAGAGPMGYRVLIPVFGRGGLVYGCVGRAIRPTMKPKYLNTEGIKLLWNAHKPAPVAVLTEGIFDALRVNGATEGNTSIRAVAKLGGSLTSIQLDQLKRFGQVSILPDRDQAGIKGAIKDCIQCSDAGIAVSVVIPERLDGRDPGDMQHGEIVAALRGAVSWKKSAELMLKFLLVKKYASD
jgi:hypothetical protein